MRQVVRSIHTRKNIDMWKIARVGSVFHKNGDKTQVANHSPISTLSTFATVFETLLSAVTVHQWKSNLRLSCL